jgi:uncharacterized protein YbjT (DUF2867 family)
MLGSRVAAELRTRGHDVRVFSRHAPEFPADLTTGAGLDAVLDGCDAVVDASNDASRRAGERLVEGSRRLLAAEAAAGVGHHVCVSVVGCDQVPVSYFRAKLAQEREVERGPVPWTIVRATQFHEAVAGLLASAAPWRVLPVPRLPVQTVAVLDVARAVADAAEGRPRRARIDVAGPEVVDARDLARTWRSITGSRVLLLPVPLPGGMGGALRAGLLTDREPEVQGTTRFAAWLAATTP